jgi:hypothetical protein
MKPNQSRNFPSVYLDRKMNVYMLAENNLMRNDFICVFAASICNSSFELDEAAASYWLVLAKVHPKIIQENHATIIGGCCAK